MRNDILSWNRIPRVSQQRALLLSDRFSPIPLSAVPETYIPFGNGRSYSDVCLNPSGAVLLTRGLDHLISFDRTTGQLMCESGVLLSEILAFIVPQGWFLPVTPGTQFATVGGCVANDVHGKNHHSAGSFGHHVRSFILRRSDGQELTCSRTENAEWFAATIGGLGLTGVIMAVTFDLVPIANPFMITQATRFESLSEFWCLNSRVEQDWPYTVAWIDCTSVKARGILFAGKHAPPRGELPAWKSQKRCFPIELPFSCVNSLSLRAFNEIYYRQPLPDDSALTHYIPYFYPLDAIQDWNRLYGRKGFYQYQCVLPPDASEAGIASMMQAITASGMGSFLAVLKTLGTKPSPGLLSFSREGATLALDFPNQGDRTLKLLSRLDRIVLETGGALYPAKDTRMPGFMFQKSFPAWEQFRTFVDPRFSSGFWRRATQPNER